MYSFCIPNLRAFRKTNPGVNLSYKHSACFSQCRQPPGESGVNATQMKRDCWICMKAGQCAGVATAGPVRQSSSLAPAQTPILAPLSVAALRSRGSVHPPAPCTRDFWLASTRVRGTEIFPRSCSPTGKFVQKTTALSVFDIFKTEKTLQFRLMWEAVRQAFSSPLSAVSAWNWAACVGSMRYLHTRIWNFNDSNITLSTGSSLCRNRKVFKLPVNLCCLATCCKFCKLPYFGMRKPEQ